MSRAQRLAKSQKNVKYGLESNLYEQGFLHPRIITNDHPIFLQQSPTRGMGPCDVDCTRTSYRKTPFLPNIERSSTIQRKAIPCLSLPHDDLRSKGFSPRKAGGSGVVLCMQRLCPIPPYESRGGTIRSTCRS